MQPLQVALSTGGDLFDLDIGNKPEPAMLPGQLPLLEATKASTLGAAGTAAVTEQAPTMRPLQVARERGASQPEPAEEPPLMFEFPAAVMQAAPAVRTAPCAAAHVAPAKEKDRFVALDELFGAKPVLEFGDLLSEFNERNPIAGLCSIPQVSCAAFFCSSTKPIQI